MEREPKQFWHDIVALTNPLAGTAESLRIPLFTGLLDTQKVPLAREVYRLAMAVRSFVGTGHGTFPDAQPGQILLFFPHQTPSNMRNLLPVAREAYRKNRLGGIVTAGVFPEVLREFAGCVPIVTMNQLLGRSPVRETLLQAIEARRIFSSISAALEAYDPSVAGCFRRKFGTFAREVTAAVQSADAFRHLLAAWRPACVASTSDMWPAEFQMACQASRMGIPSAVIQHGTVSQHWWPFVASFYILWGERFLRDMVAFGAPAERLLLCGMPASDGLFELADALKDERPNDSPAPVCLILSHTHGLTLDPGLAEAFRRFLKEVVPSLPHIRWKVRLHPSEESAFYQGLGHDIYARLEFCPPSTRLEAAILESDVVTTLYSTAGLEAMILGRALIVPSLSERVPELAWWPHFGGGMYVHTPQEFAQRLGELTSNPHCRSSQLARQREFLKGCFVNHGHAAEAIVDILGHFVISHSCADRDGDSRDLRPTISDGRLAVP